MNKALTGYYRSFKSQHFHMGKAQVYLGVARGENAAIKLVFGGGRRGQARLLHEIEILERCRSTHIVQFLGYSMHRSQLLLIMAYLPGGTLYDSLHHPVRRSKTYQFYNRRALQRALQIDHTGDSQRLSEHREASLRVAL